MAVVHSLGLSVVRDGGYGGEINILASLLF